MNEQAPLILHLDRKQTPVAVRSSGATGVMFSIDTDTGFPHAVLLNGAWGLGESMVQGSVDPDEFKDTTASPWTWNGPRTARPASFSSSRPGQRPCSRARAPAP